MPPKVIEPKICILAAGRGTRNHYAHSYVKGLLPIGNQPVLSYLLDCLPKLELVIAIGHRGYLYEEFFEVAYPNRKVSFVRIDRYEGPDSGPGYSLLCCKEYLQCPFFLIPTDALIEEPLAIEPHDWMGVAEVSDARPYCIAKTNQEEKIVSFLDKPSSAPPELLKNAFTGIAFIRNYQHFFNGLRKGGSQKKDGEWQVAHGFLELIKKVGLRSKRLGTWSDVGTTELFKKSVSSKGESNLVKDGEYTYLFSEQVVKYYENENYVTQKMRRAEQLLPHVPRVSRSSHHFYSYQFVKGHLLSEERSSKRFVQLLNNCQTTLFHPVPLSDFERKQFEKNCLEFYQTKTLRRIDLFHRKFGNQDHEVSINNIVCPPLSSMLDSVNWSELSKGIPTKFHGDLQPENIIVTDSGYKLIDWRHEFGNKSMIGDAYYDLGKVKHALIVSGNVIRKGAFSIEKKNQSEIKLHFALKKNLVEFLPFFHEFLEKHSYDSNKVDTLVALIYLNIAPLYNKPYGEFLFYLGRLYLLHAVGRLAVSEIGLCTRLTGA